jgi:uncharacterized secreted repeat protein (TIGR03808 family)
MSLDRRHLLATGLAVPALVAAASAGPRLAAPGKDQPEKARRTAHATGLVTGSAEDQTSTLQALIDEAANRGAPLELPAGRFRTGHLTLRPGTRLIGASGMTVLEFAGGPAFLTGENADGILLSGLTLDGARLALDPDRTDALVSFRDCAGLEVRHSSFVRSLLNGLSLTRSSGVVTDSSFAGHAEAAIRSLDAAGLDVLHNRISGASNNGIQIWRQQAGEDGTIVTLNRIDDIGAKSGGSGENGNGVNVFRAEGVLVTGNRITDCAYSAVRANSASNVTITGNSCARLGEVALYAEFAFEGAILSSNLVEEAARGIEVTNFDEGGRLAVVQGNLIRKLKRREHEAVDKRGDGISVEADSLVTGNVIEDAPNAGIVVGWGRYLRHCHVTNNLVRKARYGILISADKEAGACLVTGNMIAGASDGAIRLMNHGTAEGPDLAQAVPMSGRLAISGNVRV